MRFANGGPSLAARIKLYLQGGRFKRVSFGRDVRIVGPVNLYGCYLGDSVRVGPFVEIQDGAVIGARSKIQSHSFVCSLVYLGEDCFVGHGVTFINDKLIGGPAGGDRTKWNETHVGNRVSIGSNSTILPVRIADDVVIGAGSVVTRDISESGTYVGNPARKLEGR